MREALPAKDGTTLSWAKGDGRLLATLAAGCASFDARIVVPLAGNWRRSEDGHALGLAGFAALGLVPELLVVEKQLFPGGECKLPTAVDALEYLVLKFH